MSQDWNSQESAALLMRGANNNNSLARPSVHFAATAALPGPPLATVTQTQDDITTEQVILRIEELAATIIAALDEERMPVLETYPSEHAPDRIITKRFSNMSQCRSFTSILMVTAFCHSLLLANRTTTTREVYYFYVTHFRSQKECDLAIMDAAQILQVPRASLGLKASPRGWFTGDIQLVHKDGGVILDGRALQSVQGSPISSDWLKPKSQRNFTVQSVAAECILVVEKDGVYNRLSEDRFFDDYPCILVTGKGFPDLATRAMVHDLHTNLGLPVRGLADCDPFGVMVLHTYQHGSKRQGVDGGDRFAVPMDWVGLRPSQVEQLKKGKTALPKEVFQELTDLDKRRLDDHLLSENHRWTNFGQDERRMEELQNMLDSGHKVELEALNWLGMDYCSEWVCSIFDHQDQLEAGNDDGEEWLEII
jgi:meiotic recombination protein SPO11